MSKKKYFDFNVGLLGVVAVSYHEAYKQSSADIKEKKELGEQEKKFRQLLADVTKQTIKKANLADQFPTEKPICLFVLQYFVSERDYREKDVDNMAKAILDTFKGVVYKSDAQVKTLLVVKELKDDKVDRNFLYIAGKEHKRGYERFVKEAGIQQAHTLFQKISKEQRIAP